MALHGSYFLPHKATQPIIGSIGLFVLLAGFSNYLNGSDIGPTMMWVGAGTIIYMMFIWFAATFIMGYYARELAEINFFGWPLSFYMGAQGSLIIYVVIIWYYARAMGKLDEEFGVAEDE